MHAWWTTVQLDCIELLARVHWQGRAGRKWALTTPSAACTHACLQVVGSGSAKTFQLTYTHTALAKVSDTLAYQATDDSGLQSVQGTITVQVVAATVAPVITPSEPSI